MLWVSFDRFVGELRCSKDYDQIGRLFASLANDNDAVVTLGAMFVELALTDNDPTGPKAARDFTKVFSSALAQKTFSSALIAEQSDALSKRDARFGPAFLAVLYPALTPSLEKRVNEEIYASAVQLRRQLGT